MSAEAGSTNGADSCADKGAQRWAASSGLVSQTRGLEGHEQRRQREDHTARDKTGYSQTAAE